MLTINRIANLKSACTKPLTYLQSCVLLLTIFCILLSPQSLWANEGKKWLVANMAELNKALNEAKPGDEIVMKNGDWKDAEIHFKANATKEAPIVLRAETSGKVTISGVAALVFESDYLQADGLVFTNGYTTAKTVVGFESSNCILSNSAIIGFNPPDFKTKSYWVFFKGNYNHLTNCYFTGKNNVEPLVGNDLGSARHNKVSGCYFKDIPYAKQNGREILRIWGPGKLADPSPDGAFFTVEGNLFDHADGEGVEIISLKSNHNIVRNNTVLATMGGITNRQGHDNVFEGNIIIGEKRSGTLGIRVTGENLRVANNYVADVAEDGLLLMAGEYVEANLTDAFKPQNKDANGKGLARYRQVKNSVFENNYFLYVGGTGITIGSSYKRHWPEHQMVLLPEKNVLKNNLVVSPTSAAISITVPEVIGDLKFATNSYQGNIAFEALMDKKQFSTNEFATTDPKLKKNANGLWQPTTKMNVLPLNLKLLSPKDVGPLWMR